MKHLKWIKCEKCGELYFGRECPCQRQKSEKIKELMEKEESIELIGLEDDIEKASPRDVVISVYRRGTGSKRSVQRVSQKRG